MVRTIPKVEGAPAMVNEKNHEAWEGVIVLTGIAELEGDQYVSLCRELGTSSCGDTAEEALRSLGDAIDVHVNAMIETGELFQVLRERNINIVLSPLNELSLTVPLGKIFTTYQHPVPVAGPAL